MIWKQFLKSKSNLKGYKENKDKDIIELDSNILHQELANGVQIADPCMVDEMKDVFAWKRGFQNCWTGYPNDGKSQFTLYMMVVKSLLSKWKWVIWSPEMRSANFIDGKIKVHYNDLAYEIMATCSGKTPYKHIHEKYHIPLMTIEEIDEWAEFCRTYFIPIDPKEKTMESIYDGLTRIYDTHGFDGIMIDPYKNIDCGNINREDKFLHKVFDQFKDLALRTNSVMNWVAHPKSGVDRIDHNGNINACNQYMLSGGAAWDNSMDGIYSVLRPNTREDPTSPDVHFYNLKQRKQELVCQRGRLDDIRFDIKTRRYIFNGNDPLGGPVSNDRIESFPVAPSNFEHSPF